VGCSTAQSLARHGASVVLLEQNTLTSGTTWHAAGLLGTLKGNSMMCSLARYGMQRYRDMNDCTTGNSLVGWTNTGSMGIARCHDSMEQLMRQWQVAQGLGHTHHRIVCPKDIKDIHPFLDLKGIVGGVYSPEDGICNPADVALWIAKEARAHGAAILESTECKGIRFDQGLQKVLSVTTTSGEEIHCGSAVLCGGAWTKKLSKLLSGNNRVPVAMMPHQYTIFDKIEGVGGHLPVVRDIHHKYYLKPEVGGFMVGIFEGEPLEHLPDAVRARNANSSEMPRDAAHEIYDESFDKAGRWLEAAMSHVPALNEVGVKQWLHGPDTHSVDHNPLIGLVPGTENAYMATGFNSQGIQCGPGTGVALTEMILDGAPHSLGCDFSAADPSRVYPKLCDDAEWVEMRAAEGYGKLYSIHYPHEMFESARGRRLSPLHSQLEELGAVFGETFGWERPLYFPHNSEQRLPSAESLWRDICVPSPVHSAFSFDHSRTEFFPAEERECFAARTGAALFDLSSFGKLRVKGPQALQVLQRCMTAELDRPVGTVVYTLYCNSRGGILGDLTVARLSPDEFYLVTLTNQPGKVADRIQHVARSLGVHRGNCLLEDVTEAKAVLAVNGPRSRSVLAPLSSGSLENDAFPPGTAQQLQVAGINVLALRVSFAGELGWELHVPAAEAPHLFNALTAAGAPHSMRLAGYMSLLHSLRIEKGFVHYGADVSMAETPLEAGLGFACKLKPGQVDFVGKEAILAQKQTGWTKRLVSVQAEKGAHVSLWGHEEELLYRDDLLVGALTSGGFSHTLGCPIGLGFVHGPSKLPRDWLESGRYEVQVPVQTRGGAPELKRFPVTISTKCLVDAQGTRIRGDGGSN